MDKDIFENAIWTAESDGFYRARCEFIENLLNALIKRASKSYQGEYLHISDEKFTAILTVANSHMVNRRLEELKKEGETDE